MRRPLSATIAACLFTTAAFGQQPPQWQLVEDVRYGDGDTRREALFSGVGDVARAPDGRLFVLQPVDRAIRVFSPNGEFLQSFGRDGDGPGEFRRPMFMAIVRDSLWVNDPTHQRVSFFSLAGKFLVTQPILLPRRDPFMPALPIALLRDGSAIGRPAVLGNPDFPTVSERVPLVRYRRDGVIHDTVRFLRRRNDSGSIQSPTMGFMFVQPFGDGPIHAAAPNGDGLVVVDRETPRAAPGSFTVTRYGANGGRAFERTHSYTPIPLPRQLADSLSAAAIPRLPPGAPQIDPKAVDAAFFRPAFLPTVTDIVVAEDGSMWLRGERTEGPRVNYRILDPKGSIVGTVSVPATTTVKYATATHVWAFDMADEPMLIRYRINPAGARPRG